MSSYNFINEHTPSQDIFFKPFTQRFHSYYDHKTSKHNFYITPEFGKYSRIIGQNTIIEGFNIASFTRTNTNISITVSRGRCIINDTYIEIDSSNTITFQQANALDQNGKFVLSLSFLNENSLRDNKLRYHLTYFTQTNTSFGNFNKINDQIILGVFAFEKNTSNNITKVNYLNTLETITLDSKVYKIRNNETHIVDSVLDGGLISGTVVILSEGGQFFGNNLNQLIAAVSESSYQVLKFG
jgi:hypothetical protein